jgi:hypothetical protein
MIDDYFKKLMVKGYLNNFPSRAVKLALTMKTSSRMNPIIAKPAKAPPIYNKGEGLLILILILSKALISKKSIPLKILNMKNGMVNMPITILYNRILI